LQGQALQYIVISRTRKNPYRASPVRDPKRLERNNRDVEYRHPLCSYPSFSSCVNSLTVESSSCPVSGNWHTIWGFLNFQSDVRCGGTAAQDS
jgi:hypothetical protein